jgi:hypothetical protein
MSRKRSEYGLVMIVAGLILAGNAARGNGLTVSNVTLLPSTATESFIQFDISWNNSWRAAVKGDGAAVASPRRRSRRLIRPRTAGARPEPSRLKTATLCGPMGSTASIA